TPSGDLFAGSQDGPVSPPAALDVDPRLLSHRAVGPLLRRELSKERPSAGYIRGLANVERDEDLRDALRALAVRVQARFGYVRSHD
ncbi:MAG TPA: hypothetical protein VFA48_08825, partial [Gammaproteobacteria bacterium]|nr:hypothetical protein [Gammaproteobacteria bacterium]